MNLEELKKIREKAQKDVELRQKQARIRIRRAIPESVQEKAGRLRGAREKESTSPRW